jgi:hypothetical protein
MSGDGPPTASGVPKGSFDARELDRETEVQTKFLHVFGDFSQSAISRQTGGNSVDMSNRYFQNCTGNSNPIRSASKSLILQIELWCKQFARHSRQLAAPTPQIPN